MVKPIDRCFEPFFPLQHVGQRARVHRIVLNRVMENSRRSDKGYLLQHAGIPIASLLKFLVSYYYKISSNASAFMLLAIIAGELVPLANITMQLSQR